MRDLPLLDALLRRRFVFLGAVALLLWAGGSAQQSGYNDWEYFTWGSDQLFGTHDPFPRAYVGEDGTSPGGLHLYASYPFLQIGPPGLLIAKVLRFGPREGLYVAGALVELLGFLAVWLTDRALNDGSRRAHLTSLVSGSFVLVVWGSLTHYTHLDDAITLAAAAGALLAVRRGHAVPAGALLGLAAASKPWGVAAMGLALALPSWRGRLTAAAAGAGVVLALWGPFVLADAGTLHLGEVGLTVAGSSTLTLVGIHAVTHDQSLRLLQLVGGLVLAAALSRTRGWAAALLAAFSLRMLVEPSPYPYYVSAVALAALAVDLAWLRVPVLTALTITSWFAVNFSQTDTQAAWFRAVTYVLLLGAALLSARSGPWPARAPRQEPAPRPPSGTG